MKRRPKIGDIIEIDVAATTALYAQYTHQHPVFGSLIRVFDIRGIVGLHPPLRNLIRYPVCFSVFYPLRMSLNRDIFKVIGNVDLTEETSMFPIFKDGHIDPITKSVHNWWLWDGDREWFVGHLDQPEKYPLRQVVNDTLLREMAAECGRKHLDIGL